MVLLVLAAGAVSAQAQEGEESGFAARYAEFQAFRAELGAEIAALSLLHGSFKVLAEFAKDAAVAVREGPDLVVAPGAVRARVCDDRITRDWCALLPARFREPPG